MAQIPRDWKPAISWALPFPCVHLGYVHRMALFMSSIRQEFANIIRRFDLPMQRKADSVVPSSFLSPDTSNALRQPGKFPPPRSPSSAPSLMPRTASLPRAFASNTGERGAAPGRPQARLARSRATTATHPQRRFTAELKSSPPQKY